MTHATRNLPRLKLRAIEARYDPLAPIEEQVAEAIRLARLHLCPVLIRRHPQAPTVAILGDMDPEWAEAALRMALGLTDPGPSEAPYPR